MAGPSEAITEWAEVVGADHCITDPGTLAAYGTTTFPTDSAVTAVIRPKDRDEVVACVRIAGAHGEPLYPISRGRNWGLGSRAPVTAGCAVLDLSRMDRIVDFDEALGYITVEPGVTFLQVADYLYDRDSNLFSAATGGPPDGSLIGNALERGEGPGPYGDRFANSCAMEVVLPNGEVLTTGFARFDGARSAFTAHDGVGPVLDGLFTQSNLGIVTRMTFWLHPRPKDFRVFTGCVVGGAADVAPMIDSLRSLTQEGTLQPYCVTIWNSYKVLAGQGRYPWDFMKGETPLRLDALKGQEPWHLVGALYSPSVAHGEASQARVEAELAESVPDLRVTDLTPDLDTMEREELLGYPTGRNVASLYWRKKEAPGLVPNPDADGCGVLWLCPEVPMVGDTVSATISFCEETIKEHGYEPNMGGMIRSGRSLVVFVAIMYDREVPGEDERAVACHDAVLAGLIDRGLYPYRLGLPSMHGLPATEPYDTVLGSIKEMLDPSRILAPGRYDGSGARR